MTQTMRKRLIKILEAWEHEVRADGMDAAFDRNTGCAGAAETLDALLAELREPDEAMRQIGRDYDGIGNEPALAGFTAMIDAVREGK